MKNSKLSNTFLFEQPEKSSTGSVLYQCHLKLIDKSRMADFAGYLMPLWYKSISAEHKAVRETAGLFDCTHMGIFEIAGSDAEVYLNLVTTNNVEKLQSGRAQYSYILDASGNIFDDIIIYRREREKFMVVVNAANEAKIKAYFSALQTGQAMIDPAKPATKLKYSPEIRDMRDTSSGGDSRVDIAIQGPASEKILFSIIEDKSARSLIEQLKPFCFIQTSVAGIDCIISRTGYTGAKIGFELFVHPEKGIESWDLLLKTSKEFSGLPCGLGARDSLRIEAGLPLYGHELAGKYNISPFEAGYGWAVKLEKEFFIGKEAVLQKAKDYNNKVVRLELPGQRGVRPVRQNDCVIDDNDKCVGFVLSCANTGEKQVALAYVSKDSVKENDSIGMYYLARNQRQIKQSRKESAKIGDSLKADITGIVLSRFEKF